MGIGRVFAQLHISRYRPNDSQYIFQLQSHF